MTSTTYLTDPLTIDQIKASLDEDGYVTGDVLVDISDAIDGDLESWLDLCSERLTGSICGMDINYDTIGAIDDGTLIVRVTLDPSMILDDFDGEPF